MKFYENPPTGSRVVPCGRTGRQTEITKLIVAFHNFANAPKIQCDSAFPRNAPPMCEKALLRLRIPRLYLIGLLVTTTYR